MKHLNPQHFNNNQLKEVAEPTQNSDAATKGYVDAGQRIYFGVCNTAGDVADKVVTAPGYTPAEGKILVVKFNDAVRCFDLVTQTWIHLTMNVNNTGALYLETYTYDYEYPDGGFRRYELLGGYFFYAAFQYYETSPEDKGYRLIGTTCTFEMIQNLFDRLNIQGQILSDLEQPAPIFYGITNTAEATAMKAVTLINPSDGFVNGSFLVLHFTYAVPAGNGNAISVDGMSFMLAYHQYGVTSSGVVNAGDKVLLYCYNNVAHIVSIDRWGADIQGKQDALPAIANNAGKVLAVNSGGTGLEWANNGALLTGGTRITIDADGSHTVDLTDHAVTVVNFAANVTNVTLLFHLNELGDRQVILKRAPGSGTVAVSIQASTSYMTKNMSLITTQYLTIANDFPRPFTFANRLIDSDTCILTVTSYTLSNPSYSSSYGATWTPPQQ